MHTRRLGARQVLAPLNSLERLFLRNTDLAGQVPCELVKGKPNLVVLDFSDSPVSGSLPGCILGVSKSVF